MGYNISLHLDQYQGTFKLYEQSMQHLRDLPLRNKATINMTAMQLP